MSMEMMKKAVLGAAGAIALLGAASAQALTLDPAGADGQNYTFSGTTDLSYGMCSDGIPLTVHRA